jgi:hypothetical protein
VCGGGGASEGGGRVSLRARPAAGKPLSHGAAKSSRPSKPRKKPRHCSRARQVSARAGQRVVALPLRVRARCPARARADARRGRAAEATDITRSARTFCAAVNAFVLAPLFDGPRGGDARRRRRRARRRGARALRAPPQRRRGAGGAAAAGRLQRRKHASSKGRAADDAARDARGRTHAGRRRGRRRAAAQRGELAAVAAGALWAG